MKQQNKFSLAQRFQSIKYAIEGISLLVRTEHNAKIHVTATCIVLILGACFNVSNIEWCMLIFAIGLVFIAEIINTAIEQLSNVVSPTINPIIKKVKDLAAGGVLIASLISVLVGGIIFIPKIAVFILSLVQNK